MRVEFQHCTLGNADVHIAGTRGPDACCAHDVACDRELQPDVGRLAEPELDTGAQLEHEQLAEIVLVFGDQDAGRFSALCPRFLQFFAQLLAGIGIGADRFAQYDPAGWPAMQSAFEEVESDEDEWGEPVGTVVLAKLERLPRKGDKVELRGATAEVTALSRRRVTQVRVRTKMGADVEAVAS